MHEMTAAEFVFFFHSESAEDNLPLQKSLIRAVCLALDGKFLSLDKDY